ncbi:hypothetical protein C8034_v002460 [Colletotrichum sidae]|uniref:Uncharacterized protein n=1 Tax=Colletotrichum sidae TaxID=1347389 RepID=A0A4R8TC34_9PEZI|nr:hypothetical protein C8034_v002460 [Colletotrichum sidae]
MVLQVGTLNRNTLVPFKSWRFEQSGCKESAIVGVSSDTPLKLDKRRRAESDVDGPHTAALSSKKRRLRLHLITSRLSQPFSLPATHIINRDGAASGDRRFVKLAAVATSPDPSKLGLNREGSVMLRAAVLNRVRLRVRNEASHRGDHVVAVAARNAAVVHHGAQLATGARFVAPSTALACPRQKQPPPRVFLMRPGGSSSPAPGSASTQFERLSTPGTPQASRLLPKSPRLKPTRSPLSTPSETLLEEMEDDGSVAFPMTEEECHYAWADDDDVEDVYSDFGVIFGGLASNARDEDDGSYEEYLDELDGIAWVDR